MEIIRKIGSANDALQVGQLVKDAIGHSCKVQSIDWGEVRSVMLEYTIGDFTHWIAAEPAWIGYEKVTVREVVLTFTVTFEAVPSDDQTDWEEVAGEIEAAIDASFVKEGAYPHRVEIGKTRFV